MAGANEAIFGGDFMRNLFSFTYNTYYYFLAAAVSSAFVQCIGHSIKWATFNVHPINWNNSNHDADNKMPVNKLIGMWGCCEPY